MHGPISLSFPLPLLIVGDTRFFHKFNDTFAYAPNESPLPLIDCYVLGNNGKANSDHAILYSPAALGRYLEDNHDDQMWVFTVMLDQLNQKHKDEHGKNILCQDFIDGYGTIFMRDRFLTSRKIHVTPTQVYECWHAAQQKIHITEALDPISAKNSVRKM